MYKFDVESVTKQIVCWIKDWFKQNGEGCNAIIGLSGGKDSSVVAGLLVNALGKERVIGVLMPNGEQSDIDFAKGIAQFLNVKTIEANVKDAVDGVYKALDGKVDFTQQMKNNLPPRIRMSVLYAVAQSTNGRVANTCNLSEDWVGYSTRYGDSAGDFSPLSNLTVTEVKAIGRFLKLPEKYIEKPPIDGLCGKTDEENLGFTYAVLDKYIREGVEPEAEIKEKIDRLNAMNKFKLRYMDCFVPKF